MSSVTVAAALYARMNTDVTLKAIVSGIYRNVAPPSATYPFVIMQHITGADEYTFTQRVSSQARWQIKVIDEGYSAVAAETALTRIDVLLTDQRLDVSGKTNWVIRRITRFEYAQMGEFGVIYQHVGGEWFIEMA